MDEIKNKIRQKKTTLARLEKELEEYKNRVNYRILKIEKLKWDIHQLELNLDG